MSGVYIPGLAIPEGGWHKVIKIFSDGTVVSCYDSVELAKAIPVPDHGRLIDGDELMKKGMPLSFSVQKWVQEVDIACAPTIIPAEEGEE